MDVARWIPYEDLRSIQEEVNRFFEQRATPAQAGGAQRRENVSTRVWTPPVDVYEDDEVILLRADLPGVKMEEIKIDLTSDSLTLSGNRVPTENSDGEKFVRSERRFGPFQRSFAIGLPIQIENVTANYKDGVLEIRLPKAEEVKPKRVEVKIAS
jgi:HSP20 family protein